MYSVFGLPFVSGASCTINDLAVGEFCSYFNSGVTSILMRLHPDNDDGEARAMLQQEGKIWRVSGGSTVTRGTLCLKLGG